MLGLNLKNGFYLALNFRKKHSAEDGHSVFKIIPNMK